MTETKLHLHARSSAARFAARAIWPRLRTRVALLWAVIAVILTVFEHTIDPHRTRAWLLTLDATSAATVWAGVAFAWGVGLSGQARAVLFENRSLHGLWTMPIDTAGWSVTLSVWALVLGAPTILPALLLLDLSSIPQAVAISAAAGSISILIASRSLRGLLAASAVTASICAGAAIAASSRGVWLLAGPLITALAITSAGWTYRYTFAQIRRETSARRARFSAACWRAILERDISQLWREARATSIAIAMLVALLLGFIYASNYQGAYPERVTWIFGALVSYAGGHLIRRLRVILGPLFFHGAWGIDPSERALPAIIISAAPQLLLLTGAMIICRGLDPLDLLGTLTLFGALAIWHTATSCHDERATSYMMFGGLLTLATMSLPWPLLFGVHAVLIISGWKLTLHQLTTRRDERAGAS